MKKRVLLLGLVVLMVLTGCGTTEKETKTKEKRSRQTDIKYRR